MYDVRPEAVTFGFHVVFTEHTCFRKSTCSLWNAFILLRQITIVISFVFKLQLAVQAL